MAGRPTDRRPLVLFVDDTKEIRDLYAQALSRAGFRVAEAQDGVVALVKAHALVPDVVVMDVGMAGLDGVEAARRLKTEPRTHGIPVILFTGEPVDDRIRAADCAEIVEKPCSLHRLVDAVLRQVK